ncbi:hypothetical protein EV361DRAFT_875013 [Lentinula raphanica]|nr:hypothetical protein EV361DRAFT_875013 [Lentinula raphanica]
MSSIHFFGMSTLLTCGSIAIASLNVASYPLALEDKVLLNSMAPAVPDAKSGSFAYTTKMEAPIHVDTANFKMVSDVLAADALKKSASCSEDFVGVGVDQELISSVPSHNPTFVNRNFTDAEMTLCRSGRIVSWNNPSQRNRGKRRIVQMLLVRPKHYGKANNALTRFSTIVQTGSFAVNQTLTVTPLTSMYLCASSYLQTMTLENVNVHYPLL